MWRHVRSVWGLEQKLPDVKSCRMGRNQCEKARGMESILKVETLIGMIQSLREVRTKTQDGDRTGPYFLATFPISHRKPLNGHTGEMARSDSLHRMVTMEAGIID